MGRSCCRRLAIRATTAGRPASAEPGPASAAGRKCSRGRGELRHSRRRSGSAAPTVGSKTCASSRPRRPAWHKGRGSRAVRRRPGPGSDRHQQRRACRAAGRIRAAANPGCCSRPSPPARRSRRTQGQAPELVLLPCRVVSAHAPLPWSAPMWLPIPSRRYCRPSANCSVVVKAASCRATLPAWALSGTQPAREASSAAKPMV